MVNLRYSDDNNVAFLADSGGSVFELSMKRGLRGPGASCRCIFSGSRGEVSIPHAVQDCVEDPRYQAPIPILNIFWIRIWKNSDPATQNKVNNIVLVGSSIQLAGVVHFVEKKNPTFV